MKTPYDTALRAIGREVDEVRTAVRAAADRSADADARRRDAADAIVRERALAAVHALFPSNAWLQRAGAEHDRLAALCVEADAALDRVRAQARERYGSLRVIEGAADGHRDEANRAAASAEQARIDDFACGRFARPSRRAAR